jgi:RNA-directed DNA polymerase
MLAHRIADPRILRLVRMWLEAGIFESGEKYETTKGTPQGAGIRLIEFGRFAAVSRLKRGERRPETFAFLGFTHYCGWTRDGRFIVKHKTQSNRLTRKLKALRQEAWRLMHRPQAEQHRWYASVLRRHYGYFGMPHNWRALNGFLREVRRIWFNCLRRRSQKNRRMPWAWFDDVTSCLPLPRPRITHPWTPRAA